MRKLQRDNDFNWYDFVQPGDRGLCKSFSNLKQFSVYFLNIKTSKVWKILPYLHFNNVFRLRKRFQQSVIGYLIQILMSNVLIWLPTILMTFGSYWLTNFFGLTWFAKRLAFVLDDNFVMLFFMINLNWKKLSFSYSPEK